MLQLYAFNMTDSHWIELLLCGSSNNLNTDRTWEDLDSQYDCEEEMDGKKISEDSGGVINLRVPSRIEYVNRIRHCGLGGFEYYDSMFMTANERFIAVNTKTGNLLSSGHSSTPRCEGLFIIDLEDQT